MAAICGQHAADIMQMKILLKGCKTLHVSFFKYYLVTTAKLENIQSSLGARLSLVFIACVDEAAVKPKTVS